MAPAISDDRIVWTLSTYAGLAARLLDDPESWLADDAPPAGRLGRIGHGVRRGLAGRTHPGAPEWPALSAEQRTDWWVQRIAALAAPAAATPRVFGAAADRLPIQATFSAAAQGLAVCATAREHGVVEPAAWVPLLARILLDRELAPGRIADASAGDPGTAVDRSGRADPTRGAEADGATHSDAAVAEAVAQGRLAWGASAIWRVGRALLALQSLLDERPRGRWAYRALGKVPIVGLVGGVLDERGGVRAAAAETVALIDPTATGTPSS